MKMAETALLEPTLLQLAGAFCFGALLGWYIYYINRYRKDDIKLGDLVTLIGAIGGAAVLTLFEAKTDLFGAYGIGLAFGFFAYFVVLLEFVDRSKDFTIAWFLDGRKDVEGKTIVPGWTLKPEKPTVDITDHPLGDPDK